MHVVLGILFGGFVVAGVLVFARGLRLTVANRSDVAPIDPHDQAQSAAATRRKSLPVLMYVVAVPLIIFGVTGLSTLMVVATR